MKGLIKIGLIHIYFGDGKGKTTAAAGLALRAAGHNMKVHFIQFMKGGESGEINILEKISGITVLRCSKSYGFSFNMTHEDRKSITAEHNSFLELAAKLAETEDMIILDEIFSACNCGLADKSLAEKLLKIPGRKAELVLTGHDPADFFIEHADYVSEIKAVRHPYEKGISARRGIEY
ncbi:MAG: cob(I)yrinic acid a,c-diamide adenosyltransferase [Porcipelethomonas sp.]